MTEEVIVSNYSDLTPIEKGVLYILTNPSYKEPMVKIGMTSVFNGPSRIKQLYGTGVPTPFKVEYAVTVGTVEQAQQLESLCFDTFKNVRVNPKREFFWVEVGRAISQVDSCVFHFPYSEDVTAHLQGKFDSGDVIYEDEDGEESSTSRNMVDFLELGIPMGSTLIYAHDSGLTATVVARRKLEFEDKLWSPSKLTGYLYKNRQENKYLSAQLHWTYEGELLRTIMESASEKEEEKEDEQTTLF